jgi:hypothetical protein
MNSNQMPHDAHTSGSLDGFGIIPFLLRATNIWHRLLSSVWKYKGRPFLQAAAAAAAAAARSMSGNVQGA